jgi:hypothetical protein
MATSISCPYPPIPHICYPLYLHWSIYHGVVPCTVFPKFLRFFLVWYCVRLCYRCFFVELVLPLSTQSVLTIATLLDIIARILSLYYSSRSLKTATSHKHQFFSGPVQSWKGLSFWHCVDQNFVGRLTF